MTVAEFLDWDSGDRTGAPWQLRDGEPELMAPGSEAPSSGARTIQAALAYLRTAALRERRSPWRVVIAPGVIPRVRSRRSWGSAATCWKRAGRQR